MTHFTHTRVGIMLEHAANFAKDYLVISVDAINQIQVGTVAVSR